MADHMPLLFRGREPAESADEAWGQIFQPSLPIRAHSQMWSPMRWLCLINSRCLEVRQGAGISLVPKFAIRICAPTNKLIRTFND